MKLNLNNKRSLHSIICQKYCTVTEKNLYRHGRPKLFTCHGMTWSIYPNRASVVLINVNNFEQSVLIDYVVNSIIFHNNLCWHKKCYFILLSESTVGIWIQLVWYSDHGDLFACRMVCCSDARYHGSWLIRSPFG